MCAEILRFCLLALPLILFVSVQFYTMYPQVLCPGLTLMG
jgi:hypothetical protein